MKAFFKWVRHIGEVALIVVGTVAAGIFVLAIYAACISTLLSFAIYVFRHWALESCP